MWRVHDRPFCGPFSWHLFIKVSFHLIGWSGSGQDSLYESYFQMFSQISCTLIWNEIFRGKGGAYMLIFMVLIINCYFDLQLINLISIKNASFPPWSSLQPTTMWFAEQDQRAVFWQTVCRQIPTTRFYYWRQVRKTGHGKSTCLLLSFIIFAIRNTTGIMKQNHKSLWIIGNKNY